MQYKGNWRDMMQEGSACGCDHVSNMILGCGSSPQEETLQTRRLQSSWLSDHGTKLSSCIQSVMRLFCALHSLSNLVFLLAWLQLFPILPWQRIWIWPLSLARSVHGKKGLAKQHFRRKSSGNAQDRSSAGSSSRPRSGVKRWRPCILARVDGQQSRRWEKCVSRKMLRNGPPPSESSDIMHG